MTLQTRTLGALVLSAASINATALAQTGGPNCGNPDFIAGLGVYSFDNSSTGTSGWNGFEPICDNATLLYNDLFWHIQGVTGIVRITVCGNIGFDAHMALYAGTNCGADCSFYIDDFCGSDPEIVRYIGPGPHLIQIGGVTPADIGAGVLTIEMMPPPANDTCSTAEVIAGVGSFGYDNRGSTPSGFSSGGDPACLDSYEDANFPDIFFSWTAPYAGDFLFEACDGAASNIVLYAGGGCSSTCIIRNELGFCPDLSPTAQLLGVNAGDSFLVRLAGAADAHVPAALLTIGDLGPAPVNDTCASPTVIAGTGSFPVDRTLSRTSGFDGAGLAPCSSLGTSTLSYDVFYRWTPTLDGEYTFDSCGSVQRFHLHLGGDCSATCLASASDGFYCGGGSPALRLNGIVAGTDYLIQAGSSDPSWVGTVLNTLTIEYHGQIPTGDDCSVPIVINGEGNFPYDRSAATNSGFFGGNPAICSTVFNFTPSSDLFFLWTPAITGDYVIDACADPEDTLLSLHAGSDCSATCIDMNQVGITCSPGVGSSLRKAGLVAGSPYLIQVGDLNDLTNGSVGAIHIALDTATPSNDDCASPMAISGIGSFPYERTYAFSSGFDGGGAVACQLSSGMTPPYYDVFLAWTATSDGSYKFDNCTEGVDTLMNIHSGSDCSATCIAGNRRGHSCPGSNSSEIRLAGIQAGDSFLIQLGRYNDYPTDVINSLSVELTTDPPANDNCATPTAISGIGSFAYDATWATSSGFVGGDPVTCADTELGTAVSSDVFFAWSPDCSGVYTVKPCDTSGNVSLALHLGDDCSAVCLDIGTDHFGSTPCPGTSGGADEITWTANFGDTYLMQVGRWRHDDQGVSGALEVTVQTPCNVGIQGLLCSPANPHYQGGPATLIASSTGSGVGSGLHLECTNGPTGEFGIFLIGSGANSNFPAFSGVLCLDQPTGRYNPLVATNQGLPGLNSVGMFDGSGTLQNVVGTATSSGGSGFDVPLELPYVPLGQMIQPGDSWSFQCWYRDLVLVPGDSANFSDALVVIF